MEQSEKIIDNSITFDNGKVHIRASGSEEFFNGFITSLLNRFDSLDITEDYDDSYEEKIVENPETADTIAEKYTELQNKYAELEKFSDESVRTLSDEIMRLGEENAKMRKLLEQATADFEFLGSCASASCKFCRIFAVNPNTCPLSAMRVWNKQKEVEEILNSMNK